MKLYLKVWFYYFPAFAFCDFTSRLGGWIDDVGSAIGRFGDKVEQFRPFDADHGLFEDYLEDVATMPRRKGWNYWPKGWGREPDGFLWGGGDAEDRP